MLTRYQVQKRRLLSGAVALFVLLTCLRVWVGPPGIVQPARAQIPDSAAQRKAILDEARRTNQLLTEIRQILEKRTLNVRIQGADNQAGTPAGTPDGRKKKRP